MRTAILSVVLINLLATAAVIAQPTLTTDLTGDGVSDSSDLTTLLAAMGAERGDADFPIQADLNIDGVIDHEDVLLFAGEWKGAPAPRQSISGADLLEVLGLTPGATRTILLGCLPGGNATGVCSQGVEVVYATPRILGETRETYLGGRALSGEGAGRAWLELSQTALLTRLEVTEGTVDRNGLGFTLPPQTVELLAPVYFAPPEVRSGLPIIQRSALFLEVEVVGQGKPLFKASINPFFDTVSYWIDCSEEGDWSWACFLSTYDTEVLGVSLHGTVACLLNHEGLQFMDASFEALGSERTFDLVPVPRPATVEYVTVIQDPAPGGTILYGEDLDASATELLVGAPNGAPFGTDNGSVYYYSLDGNSPSFGNLNRQITNDQTFDQSFGTTVALFRDFGIVNSAFEPDQGNFKGTFYVMDLKAGSPNRYKSVGYLEDPVTATSKTLRAVHAGNSSVFAGDIQDVIGGSAGGAIYQYSVQRNAGNRADVALLKTYANPYSNQFSNFGARFLETSRNVLVAPAAYGETVPAAAGIVYFFDSNPASPDFGRLIGQATDPSPLASEGFGSQIVMVGDYLAVMTGVHDGATPFPWTVRIVDPRPNSPTFQQVVGTISDVMTTPTTGIHLPQMTAVGNYLVVSDPNVNSGQGRVYVYNAEMGHPQFGSRITTIENPKPIVSTRFGNRLATAGNHFLVRSGNRQAGDLFEIYVYRIVE